MSPLIRDRDVLTIAPIDSLPMGLGEIVAFASPETRRLVVHRVIARSGDRYLMRGDNSSAPDGVVPERAIIGRVVRVERGGRAIGFGLGPERTLVAVLSRTGSLDWLRRAVQVLRRAAARPNTR